MPELPPGIGRTSAIARRAPFSDNPVVGTRGARTQQRILDAALQVFGECGYEATTLEGIAAAAGCSRAAVYQYFDDKEHIFRELAGGAARQLWTSVEAIEPITADQRGWDALHGWVSRHTAFHARHQPLYQTFGAAAGRDVTLAGSSARFGGQLIALFQSKVDTTGLGPRRQEAVVGLLVASLARTLDSAAILRSAVPRGYSAQRLDVAMTDVLHRTLVGVVPGVNARTPRRPRARRLELGHDLQELFLRVRALQSEAEQPGRRALAALLAAGEGVIVDRGYRGTRVEDVVQAAEVSRGAFYRYFADTHEFVRLVAARALLELSTAFAQVPDLAGSTGRRPALRGWLRGFLETSSRHGAMVQVWLEGGRGDHLLRADGAPVLDWGRQRLAHLLAGRSFGDADADAVVLLGLVEAFAGRARTAAELDAMVDVVERGVLGLAGT